MVRSLYFLFAATSALVLYVAPFFWPLVFLSQIGTLLTLYHQRPGFYLALSSLAIYIAWDYTKLVSHSFIFFFIGSLAMSWWMERMGQEREVAKKNEEEASNKEHLLFPLEVKENTTLLVHEVERLKAEIHDLHDFRENAASKDADYALLQYQHEKLVAEFAEQTQALHQRESSLFFKETLLGTVEKERREASIAQTLDSIYLQKRLRELEEMENNYKEEVKILEGIVTAKLISQKKVMRSSSKERRDFETIDLLEHLSGERSSVRDPH